MHNSISWGSKLVTINEISQHKSCCELSTQATCILSDIHSPPVLQLQGSIARQACRAICKIKNAIPYHQKTSPLLGSIPPLAKL